MEPEYERARFRTVWSRREARGHGDQRLSARTGGESHGATFTVYVEPLVGNRATFRNLGDQYWIVAGGGSSIPVDDIQHAYLHFMLDPLVLKYRLDLQKRTSCWRLPRQLPSSARGI